MNHISPEANKLAERLAAQEAGQAQAAGAGAGALCAVDKLRLPLSKLSGVEGYRTLLSRALTLAKARAPSLGALEAGPDGSLLVSGVPLSEINGDVPPQGTEDGIMLLSELLGLLILFIGEALTLQLVRAVWPDATMDHMNTEHKETLR